MKRLCITRNNGGVISYLLFELVFIIIPTQNLIDLF